MPLKYGNPAKGLKATKDEASDESRLRLYFETEIVNQEVTPPVHFDEVRSVEDTISFECFGFWVPMRFRLTAFVAPGSGW